MYRLIRTLALFLSALFATLATGGSAQTPGGQAHPAPIAPTPVPAENLARPALWKVSDADTTIYLFGTIHALPVGIEWLSGPVETALKSSTELVTEIPETDLASMQSAVAGNALLPAGQNLRAMLSAEDRAKFEKALGSFNLPVEAFDQFEPWYAAIALTSLPLAKEGYTSANGVEEHLSAAAKQLGKPRTGLETAAYQLHLFDSLPREVQLRYLHEVLDGMPTLDAELKSMILQWRTGNADKLAELLNADEDDPRMTEVLLTGRNRNWAAWVRKRMEQPGTVFMAVGAGHLAGKDSVQAILAKAGVTAVRVQ